MGPSQSSSQARHQGSPAVHPHLGQHSSHEGRSQRHRPDRLHRDPTRGVAGHSQHASLEYAAPGVQHPAGIGDHSRVHLPVTEELAFGHRPRDVQADPGESANGFVEGWGDRVIRPGGHPRQRPLPAFDPGEHRVLQQDVLVPDASAQQQQQQQRGTA